MFVLLDTAVIGETMREEIDRRLARTDQRLLQYAAHPGQPASKV
jgi:hypothetical protein